MEYHCCAQNMSLRCSTEATLMARRTSGAMLYKSLQSKSYARGLCGYDVTVLRLKRFAVAVCYIRISFRLGQPQCFPVVINKVCMPKTIMLYMHVTRSRRWNVICQTRFRDSQEQQQTRHLFVCTPQYGNVFRKLAEI